MELRRTTTTPLRQRPRPSYVEEDTPETSEQDNHRSRRRSSRRSTRFQNHGSHDSDGSYGEDDHVSPSPALRRRRAPATADWGDTATGSPAPRRSTISAYQLRARKNSQSQQERDSSSSLNLSYLESTFPNPQTRSFLALEFKKKASSNSAKPSMSSAGKWREEQVLVICPGSRTTMAQLGCNELTPPTHRFPTRMFKDGNEWRPYHTFKRTKTVDGVETDEWVEDVDSNEGAVWPIQGGRIVNMEAFLAFLDHVHSMLTTTYHNTPIMLMASPQWLRPDCEAIAQYIFEKTRTPALCLIHSAIATQYGLKQPSMTVIDIGYEKVDVTAIHDGRVVNHIDVGPPAQERSISGGEVFTKRLQKLLEGQGFNYEMAEQLKKSSICEVLAYVGTERRLVELPLGDGVTSSSGKEDGADAGQDGVKPTDVDLSGEDRENGGDDEGVLDVASIVTSGQTKEFLAKKEQEKKRGKKGKGQEPAEQPKVKLPNTKRTRNTFVFEEVIQEEVPVEKPVAMNGSAQAFAPASALPPAADAPTAPPADANSAISGDAPQPTADQPSTDQPMGDVQTEAPKPEEPKPEAAIPKPEDTGIVENATEHRAKRVRRDIEVGIERFTFAERAEIDRIVTAIYKTIQGVDDMYMRPACWDNLVFVGNGSRLKGLKDNILQTLNARHLVSPSTATMFTSELPSNMATPTGTGSQTPTGSVSGAPHQLGPSGGVNPLLQAATTASSLGVAAAQGVGTPATGSETGGPSAATTHHFHSQTPTSIKTLTLPTYLQEWTKNGFEEAMFLGAQVAARIAFCLHSNMDAHGIEAQRLASLSRVDYNELGPKGIRTHSMLN